MKRNEFINCLEMNWRNGKLAVSCASDLGGLRLVEDIFEDAEKRLEERYSIAERCIESGSKFMDDGMHAGVELLTTSTVLPQVVRQSMFLMSFAEAESAIVALLSKYIEPKTKVKLKHLKHGGIRGARLYIELVADISLPGPILLNSEHRLLQEIRNCIAHSTGRLSDNKTNALRKGLTENSVYEPHVSLEDEPIELGQELIPFVCGRWRDTILNLSRSIDESKWVQPASHD
jgi:hypothetical protein